MYRYIKWLGVACLGASLFFSGCGSDKKDISKAPLVKTMVIGEINDLLGWIFSFIKTVRFYVATARQTYEEPHLFMMYFNGKQVVG